jgi:NAD(P)-dependent dehydrogenase (short-subunit alcohol dehydrogenase family)
MSYSGFDLSGKVAVVVGGTSGIGRVIGVALAQAGADVVPTARRKNMVAEAVREIRGLGRRSFELCSDVNDRSSLENVLAAVIREFGKVDILVYAAGITNRKPFLEVTEKEWREIIEVNLNGAFHTCQVFGGHMVEQRHGRIINIASLGSYVGLSEVAAYGASKSGLAALTRTLAVEWAQYGVRVNAIMPGVFRTDMNSGLLDGTPRGQEFLLRTPMKRFGKVDELAGGAIYLASDAASFVTGILLHVDGGFLASGVNQ